MYNGVMSGNVKKKVLMYFIILILVLIVIDKIFVIEISYKTTREPYSTYNVEISKITKKLKMYENNYCVDDECNNELIRKSIKLTDREYSYIKDILRQNYNKESFMNAISALVKDEAKMFEADEEGYEESDDLNSDGVVTYREFADSFLEILAK